MKKIIDNTNRETFRLYWKFAWNHKSYVIGSIIMSSLFVLLYRYLPPLIVSKILDRINTGDFVKGDLVGSFGALLLSYALVVFGGGVLAGRVLNYIVWKLEMNVMADIHRHIFNHLLEQSNNFHANRFGGSLVSQTNKFAGGYIRMYDTLIFQTISLVLSFVFSVVILYPRAPGVALFLVMFSILFIVIAISITKKVREMSTIWAQKQTRQTGYLADAVSNVIAVKSFARLKFENNRFIKATNETRKAMDDTRKVSISRELVFSSSNGILLTSSLAIAVAGVVLYDYNVATVFLVFSYIGIIAENLWVFSNHSLKNINNALGDAYDMTKILAITPSIQDPLLPLKLSEDKGNVDFKNITFTHADNDRALFNNLSLSIKPGEKIGLVGHSGSGKTTITSLILRFADLDAGTIEVDGQDISQIKQSDLRSKITYVPQEPLMFHRTIAENIAYGNPKATQEQITAIAKLANAHEFIHTLPLGYDTLVGERGVKLSGGQRQRIAIARAMIKNAPILVLDEATSALDSESEKLIQQALWKLMEGRTAIVIAHRLSTIQKMDRIIVLDRGKILEQGTHDQLLKNKGKYAELWAHQSGGFIED